MRARIGTWRQLRLTMLRYGVSYAHLKAEARVSGGPGAPRRLLNPGPIWSTWTVPSPSPLPRAPKAGLDKRYFELPTLARLCPA